MKPHEKRIIEEQNQLDKKIEELTAFIATDASSELPKSDRDKLTLQLEAMEMYSEILGQRIYAFL